MKKIFFFALAVSVFTSLSATAAPPLQPGCSPVILEVHQHQSDAVRMRDKAYTRQIVQQADSALGLTCFDQQLKLTSRLGLFFSDIVPQTDDHPHDVSQLLAGSLGIVVNPSLVNILTNFQDSLSVILETPLSLFGAWRDGKLNALIPLLGTMLGGFLSLCADSLIALLGTPSMDCQRMTDIWSNNAATGNTSIEGNGIQTGTSYTNIQDILAGSPAGMGADFISQLGNDSAILSAAKTDLTTTATGGSGSATWPKPPSFSTASTTTEIIECMNSPSDTACQ